MKRPNPVRELERRTAAGEIAPIPAAGRWNGDRARRAALAQLRLRSRTSESGPVPRMLAEVRRIFVESAICETPDVLARMVPDDAFRTLLATQNDEDFDAEILRLGMVGGLLSPKEFSAAAPSATSSPTWSAPNARVARNRRRMTFVATTGRPATALA